MFDKINITKALNKDDRDSIKKKKRITTGSKLAGMTLKGRCDLISIMVPPVVIFKENNI